MIDHITLRDTARDSVLSRAWQYGYVPISKAANTNVKRLLWQIEHDLGTSRALGEQYFSVHNYGWRFGKPDADTPWLGFEKTAIEDFYLALAGKKLLTVVRNPYVRLLSGYLEKIANKRGVEDNLAARFQLPSVPETFADFIHMVCDREDRKTDIHFRSQTYASLFDFLPFHTIGHVETLTDDFGRFSADVLGQDFSHLLSEKADHAMSARKKLQDHYTPEIAGKVYARFRDDFLNFGYDHDLEAVAPTRPAARAGALAPLLMDAVYLCAPTMREGAAPKEPEASAAAQAVVARLEAGTAYAGFDKSLVPYARKILA